MCRVASITWFCDRLLDFSYARLGNGWTDPQRPQGLVLQLSWRPLQLPLEPTLTSAFVAYYNAMHIPEFARTLAHCAGPNWG
jgi:hypothetical protein